jgi:hypothetical protein
MKANLDDIRIEATASVSWPEGQEHQASTADPKAVEPEAEKDNESSEESES